MTHRPLDREESGWVVAMANLESIAILKIRMLGHRRPGIAEVNKEAFLAKRKAKKIRQ